MIDEASDFIISEQLKEDGKDGIIELCKRSVFSDISQLRNLSSFVDYSVRNKSSSAKLKSHQHA